MTYGNISAGILSWWGQGSNSDKRVNTILNATPASSNPNFRWALYHENESMGDPAQSQIQNDLSYIQTNYAKNQSFLRSTASSWCSCTPTPTMPAAWPTAGSTPTKPSAARPTWC